MTKHKHPKTLGHRKTPLAPKVPDSKDETSAKPRLCR